MTGNEQGFIPVGNYVSSADNRYQSKLFISANHRMALRFPEALGCFGVSNTFYFTTFKVSTSVTFVPSMLALNT